MAGLLRAGKRLREGLAALTIATLVAAMPAHAGDARFAWFEYSGTDGDALAHSEYRNPILAGFYPDPSIVRVGAGRGKARLERFASRRVDRAEARLRLAWLGSDQNGAVDHS